MRCNICDKVMGESEGAFNVDLQTFEPCNNCLNIAMDAAYSDGFQYDDDGVVGVDVGEESEDERATLDYTAFLSVRVINPFGEDDE